MFWAKVQKQYLKEIPYAFLLDKFKFYLRLLSFVCFCFGFWLLLSTFFSFLQKNKSTRDGEKHVEGNEHPYISIGPVGTLTSVGYPWTEALVTAFWIILLQVEEARFAMAAVFTFNIILKM